MNAPVRSVQPAYGLLQPAQKSFVDAFIAKLEAESVKRGYPVFDLLGEAFDNLERFAETDQRHLINHVVKISLYDLAIAIDDRAQLAESNIMKIDYMIISARLDWFYDFSTEEWRWDQVTPDQMLALKSVKVIEKIDGTIDYKIELYDKHASIERQSKVMQMQGPNSDFWTRNKPPERSPRGTGKVGGSAQNRYSERLQKWAK